MRILLGLLLQFGLVSAAIAQQSLPPALSGIASAMTAQQPLPPALLALLQTWVEPPEPLHIVGPIHYIGTRRLAAYLIATPAGHILLDGGMPSSAGDFEASIRKLGFKPEDIRLLLITHAHIDHAGTTAHFKKLSGATVAVMDRDFEHLKSGGKTDPVYGTQPPFYFPPVAAERVLQDGDTASLGTIRMTARLGAGHTQGATTWITTVEDGGKSYNVVFPCCTNVNPGYRLVVNLSYPGIADDFRRSLSMLESLQPDIWLAAHTQSFGFEDKRTRAAQEGVRAWVDPEGYRRWIAQEKATFEALVAKEQ